jgi:DNA-binding transcriptional MerR regulator
MDKIHYTIGQLGKETGCKVPTIRYYEKIGMLPEPRRSSGNQRIYGPDHLVRLAFIRHCRELGFSQPAIRDLLKLTDDPNQSCEAVDRIASSHLVSINDRIARLSALKTELEHMLKCCKGGKVSSCRIVETLADYSHRNCVHDSIYPNPKGAACKEFDSQ